MNPSRIPLIAGNWKMSHGGASGVALAGDIAETVKTIRGVEIVVVPPYTALAAVASKVEEVAKRTGHRPIGVGAQDIYFETEGAFTGEVSGSMLVETGCRWVLVGHSERRQLFGDDDALVAKKALAAVGCGLRPIVCVGETLDERQAGKTLDVVLRQVRAVMAALTADKGGAVLAYEPVWAIGGGKVATPADAQEVHAAIRGLIRDDVNLDLAKRTHILYGGSVNADDARDLFAQADLDGALVGGASLEAESFVAIVKAAAARVAV